MLNGQSLCVGMLGRQRALAGDRAEGVVLLERATGLAEQRRELYTLCRSELARRGASRGRDLERARRCGQASLEMARAQPQRGVEAWAWRLLGEIGAPPASPDVAGAEAAFREALARAAELGMRPLVAHCHLGLSGLYGRVKDRARAAEHLTVAAGLYRELDMPFWLERTGRAGRVE